jgi:hypothetical protein
MRPTPWLLIEKHRIQAPGFETKYGDNYGLFVIPFNYTGVKLRVMAQSGENSRNDLGNNYAWDHVSVSLPKRIPYWDEMAHIKELFWEDHETVMQLHVPKSKHINFVKYCLHLWRPLDEKIPLPPITMV